MNSKNNKNNCESLVEIEKSFLEGGINVEPSEIKEKFDQVDKKINLQDERLRTLEIEFAKNNETLSNVKQGQEELKGSIQKIENNIISNHNAVLNSLNTLIINKNDNLTKIEMSKNEKESKVETAKIDNKGKIYIQLFIFLGGLATVCGTIYVAMKQIYNLI